MVILLGSRSAMEILQFRIYFSKILLSLLLRIAVKISKQNCILLQIIITDFDNHRIKYHSQLSLNAKDFYGWTALMKAAYRGYIKIVKALVENGANVNVKNKGGLTASDIAEGLMAQPEILGLLR
jgi:ankyrin repeat protein